VVVNPYAVRAGDFGNPPHLREAYLARLIAVVGNLHADLHLKTPHVLAARDYFRWPRCPFYSSYSWRDTERFKSRLSVAKLCVLIPAGKKIRCLRSASSYYTNWHTNPSQTPLNIGNHVMPETSLSKPFCDQPATAVNVSSLILDQ
jgi:hypothetical protein